jgi:hypothetical protein
MTTRAALTAGTVLSVAVTAVWSLSATATIGPAAPLHLTTGDLPGDYLQLASAPTGSRPWALLAVTAAIYALCLLASGLRARGKARREAARDVDRTEDAEAVPVSGRSR